jgi:DNA-binding MarR family transcriptional regulator
MSLHAPLASDKTGFLTGYLDTLSLVERLHRLLLDVIKDEFERVGVLDINAVQALLLFNIGDHEVTAGELKTRGYYQGSNVSYNLKKLVEMGYMHHQRCEIDRRSVRVRLTEKGRVMCATRWRSFSRATPRDWKSRACWRRMGWTA